MEVDAELFEDHPVFKIRTPARIIGIGLPHNLAVAHDLGVGWNDQPEPNRLAVWCLLSGISRKQPLVPTHRMPVSMDYPVGRFLEVSASGPSPQASPNRPLHFVECVSRRCMAVIIDPTPDDGVEHSYQVELIQGLILTSDRSDFIQERMHVLFRGLGE